MSLLDELDTEVPQRLRLVDQVPEPAAKSPMQLAWERWKPEVEKATGEDAFYPAGEVERQLASGQAVIMPGKACAIIIQFEDFPGKRKAARVWWAVGDLAEIEAMVPGLEAWARGCGCTDVIVEGRGGWGRKLKALGYGQHSVILRKVL